MTRDSNDLFAMPLYKITYTGHESSPLETASGSTTPIDASLNSRTPLPSPRTTPSTPTLAMPNSTIRPYTSRTTRRS